LLRLQQLNPIFPTHLHTNFIPIRLPFFLKKIFSTISMILRVKDYLLVSIIVEKTRATHGSKV
jgi:hypothetical protein